MGSLKGKVALVTGAGQGIGQGIALALASEGVDVAVAGRTKDSLEGTCNQLRERGVRAELVLCDVAKTGAADSAVRQTVSALGGLDILVNNAYSGDFGPLLSMDDESFQRGFHSGPFATFAFMKAAHPHLKERAGSVVNLTSNAVVQWDTSNQGAYVAAKLAIQSLTRTAASEWGRDGIRVNCIAPQAKSPALTWWMDAEPERAEEFLGTIPLGRVGDCEQDIGRGVVALVGADTAYLTGATIPLDGGKGRF